MKLKITRMKAWRAKTHALKQIIGDESLQYSRLYDYKYEILRSNLVNTIEFKEPNGVFAGMYICLVGLRDGFNAGCRHLIYVDGCWLKGQYSGHLLAAIGIDPNDCLYLIA